MIIWQELAQIELLTWLIGGSIVLFVSLCGAFIYAVINAPFIDVDEVDEHEQVTINDTY